MNKIFLSGISLAVIILVAGCKKDNYDPPASTLKGRVVYQGQPLGVRSNGVQLELWQPGFQLYTKIPVYIAQDGSFSAALFDGDYKLTRLRGNGPWVDNTDTINVQVRGNSTVDVPVDPYFIVKSEAYSKTTTTITGVVTLQKVNTTRALELVRIYVGQTIVTDQTNNAQNAQVAASAIPDVTQPITLNVAIPAALATKDYVYVRVGVKTVGVAELVYGVPQKVMLK